MSAAEMLSTPNASAPIACKMIKAVRNSTVSPKGSGIIVTMTGRSVSRAANMAARMSASEVCRSTSRNDAPASSSARTCSR